MNSSYSYWYDIGRGKLQGQTLGPNLFNLFNNDLFLFNGRTNIYNFAGDNTIYNSSVDLKTILKDLKYDMETLLRWFKKSIKADPKKFQFMTLGTTPRQPVILKKKIQIKIKKSQKVVLLGFTIHN